MPEETTVKKAPTSMVLRTVLTDGQAVHVTTEEQHYGPEKVQTWVLPRVPWVIGGGG